MPRAISSRGFDYGESGMDVFPGQDTYESFRSYQTALLAQFDRLSVEFNFETLDASADANIVFAQLRTKVQRFLDGDLGRERPAEAGTFSREYLHRVFEYAAAATMRRNLDPAVSELREAIAANQSWPSTPVAAHFSPQNGDRFFERK